MTKTPQMNWPAKSPMSANTSINWLAILTAEIQIIPDAQTAKIGPKPRRTMMKNELKSCCDEHCANYGCNQGRDCPARKPAQIPITMVEMDAEEPWITAGSVMSWIIRVIELAVFAFAAGVIWTHLS